MKLRAHAPAAFVLAVLCACRADDDTRKSEQTTTMPQGLELPSVATSAPKRPIPLEELERITEEDYEEDAMIDISAETLEEELDRLEREIGD